ncbi:putative glucan endo-1,3-beta-D-glucosidase [Helianthus annuus]|nr:putative glucan endo-1,3-beta-D-glucosidase [Helianthus annuus]
MSKTSLTELVRTSLYGLRCHANITMKLDNQHTCMFSTVVLVVLYSHIVAATWCVFKSEASREVLQAAIGYACGTGADCGSLQLSGLCFLPNTIQAHASFAFNRYYMC